MSEEKHDAATHKLADETPTRDGRWRLTSHVETGGQRYVVSSVALWHDEDAPDEISPRFETKIWPADDDFVINSRDWPAVFEARFSSAAAARANHLRHVTDMMAGKTWEAAE